MDKIHVISKFGIDGEMSDFNLLLLSIHSAPRTECTNPTAACRT